MSVLAEFVLEVVSKALMEGTEPDPDLSQMFSLAVDEIRGEPGHVMIHGIYPPSDQVSGYQAQTLSRELGGAVPGLDIGLDAALNALEEELAKECGSDTCPEAQAAAIILPQKTPVSEAAAMLVDTPPRPSMPVAKEPLSAPTPIDSEEMSKAQEIEIDKLLGDPCTTATTPANVYRAFQMILEGASAGQIGEAINLKGGPGQSLGPVVFKVKNLAAKYHSLARPVAREYFLARMRRLLGVEAHA